MAIVGRRSILKWMGISAAVGGSGIGAPGCAEEQEEGTAINSSGVTTVSDGDEFDYVVIGSGAGGGPLAANLARAGFRTLVIEAGVDLGTKPDYVVPLLNAMSTEDPEMRWDFFVDHYDDPNQQAKDSKLVRGKGVLYPRAATLGGCTAHHAMLTVRPHDRDWDSIAEATGDKTWESSYMNRYFAVLEKCDYLRSEEDLKGHGTSGWLNTTRANPIDILADKGLRRLVAAADKLLRNLPRPVAEAVNDAAYYYGELVKVLKTDLNRFTPDRDRAEGMCMVPASIANGRRIGARDYLVQAVTNEGEPIPVTIQMGALVTRIVFEERDGKPHAVGVEFQEGKNQYKADPNGGKTGKVKRVKARREVIVSGGTFNTPQILMLSGIGPKADLEKLGIPVVSDVPGVGKNLQDRYEVSVVSEFSAPWFLTKACTFDLQDPNRDPCGVLYLSARGPYATNGVVCGIVKRSEHAHTPEPDLFILGLPSVFRGYKPGYSVEALADRTHFSWTVLKAHTRNQGGTVTLTSKDPRDVPKIAFRYFHEGKPEAAKDPDLEAVVDGIEFVRKINGLVPQDGDFKFKEVFPGPNVAGRDALAQTVRNEAWGHHACGTCKIGPDSDPTAVVNSRFEVRGTTGLRVVDASVFPEIPGFFIVTSVYMVSEKAADDILEKAGKPRRVALG